MELSTVCEDSGLAEAVEAGEKRFNGGHAPMEVSRELYYNFDTDGGELTTALCEISQAPTAFTPVGIGTRPLMVLS